MIAQEVVEGKSEGVAIEAQYGRQGRVRKEEDRIALRWHMQSD